jgi:hypothetical protein
MPNKHSCQHGPKSETILAAAGITAIQGRLDLGVVKTYLQIKKTHPQASLNLLYALAACLGKRWSKNIKPACCSL